MCFRILLLSFLFLCMSGLVGCSSGSSSNNNDPDAGSLEPFPTGELDLDFTFPLAMVMEEPTDVTGVATNPSDGIIAIMDVNSTLTLISPEGEFISSHLLSVSEQPADIAFDEDGDVVVAGELGTVWAFDVTTQVLEMFAQLGSDVNAIGVVNDGFFAIESTAGGYQMVSINDGQRAEITTDPRLAQYAVHAMDVDAQSLFVLVQDSEGVPFVLKFDQAGAYSDGWRISGNASGLALLEDSPRGPSVFASDNTDNEPLLRSFEPPPVPGALDESPLELLGTFALGDSGVPQPSGVTVYQNEVYFVTDFGVVAKSQLDGTDVEVLFEIEDSLQGSFESIDVNDAGEILVLASDDGQLPTLFKYDSAGIVLESSVLLNEEIVIEGLHSAFGTVYWVNAEDGEPKVIYEQSSGGLLSETPMGDNYDDYFFSGLTVFEDQLIIVTEQREIEGDVLSGLIIVWDLEDNDEIARFAAADANNQGIIDPSGIAFASAAGLLYVTSDTDDGEVFVYDFDDD